MEEDKIAIELTKNEALVLFDFLARFNREKHLDVFQDQAEQRVLWDFEGSLERQLSDPLRKDYSNIISNARNAVRDKE